MMNFRRSSGIIIKGNTEIGKRFFNDVMVFIDYLFGSDAFFFGFHGNGHTMFIASADKGNIVTLQS